MNKEQLKKRIDAAAGRINADLVIKNCNVVNVYSGNIQKKNIAIYDGIIVGLGDYTGNTEIDAKGAFALPGFIDSHIHIESSLVTPEEIGKLLVPYGATTIIADPHEIVNIAGIEGLNYMIKAAKKTALDIKFMIPSCVPSTPFEHSGAVVDADDMRSPINNSDVLGLGEFMNFPGVINAHDSDLEKLLVAINAGKLIDGHCPNLTELDLNAYTVAGITTDHECSTIEELEDRVNNGIYVQLRQGSACHNLRPLLKGINKYNSKRCVLCSDDRQPKSVFTEGHIDGYLRICVKEGIDPIIAIQMATINAAECYNLKDRGAIAPNKRADIVLVDNLNDFNVQTTIIKGQIVAQNRKYLLDIEREDYSSVSGSVHIKDFSIDRLKLNLSSKKANIIEIIPGEIVTKKITQEVDIDSEGDFIFDKSKDICKLAVIERHNNTGFLSVGLIKGYGIKEGAVALTINHDSHNIIVAGTNNEDMAFAVESLVTQEGGAVLVKDKMILESLPLPVGGIMSDQSPEWVDNKLHQIHQIAHNILGVSTDAEPLMTLCFMALPVIPEIKMTDAGLFDVTQFKFISVDATKE